MSPTLIQLAKAFEHFVVQSLRQIIRAHHSCITFFHSGGFVVDHLPEEMKLAVQAPRSVAHLLTVCQKIGTVVVFKHSCVDVWCVGWQFQGAVDLFKNSLDPQDFSHTLGQGNIFGVEGAQSGF